MNNDYLKYDGRIPEPPYTTADERRIDELLDEIETLQQDNARLRAALKEAIECLYEHAVTPDDILDVDQLERDYKRLTASIDAALEDAR